MGKPSQFDSYYDSITRRTAENIQVLCRRLQTSDKKFRFCHFERESQLEELRDMIKSELSEPYTIYTYRFFVYERPELCILAYYGDDLIGVIIGRVNLRNPDDEGLGVTPATQPATDISGGDEGQPLLPMSGYIAMIAVKSEYRRKNIGTILVLKEVEQCLRLQCDEVFLETEVNNANALRLYQKLGFYRQMRLKKYYQNGNDAYRLKLWLRPPPYITDALTTHRPMGAVMQYNDQLTLTHLLQNLMGNHAGGIAPENIRRFRHNQLQETRRDADSRLESSSTAAKTSASGQSASQAQKPPWISHNGEYDESWFKLPLDLQDLLKRR